MFIHADNALFSVSECKFSFFAPFKRRLFLNGFLFPQLCTVCEHVLTVLVIIYKSPYISTSNAALDQLLITLNSHLVHACAILEHIYSKIIKNYCVFALEFAPFTA